METEIEDLLENQTNPTIAPLAADGEVTLRITAKDESKEKCEALISQVEAEILNRVGQFYYGSDQTSLIQELSERIENKRHDNFCSRKFDRGHVSRTTNNIPGVSKCLRWGC